MDVRVRVVVDVRMRVSVSIVPVLIAGPTRTQCQHEGKHREENLRHDGDTYCRAHPPASKRSHLRRIDRRAAGSPPHGRCTKPIRNHWMTWDPDPVGLRRRHTRSRSLDDQALHESGIADHIFSAPTPPAGSDNANVQCAKIGQRNSPNRTLACAPPRQKRSHSSHRSPSQAGVSSDRWAGSYVTCVAATSAANAATEAPRRAPATGGPHRAAPLPLPPIRGRRSLETEVSRSREP